MHVGFCGGGGGCLKNRRVGGGLRVGGLGRVRRGVCSGLGRVARHDGVSSVYCALPQHVSPKTVGPGSGIKCHRESGNRRRT